MTKLESVLKVGGKIGEACSYAGISTRTYRRHLESNESFDRRMTAAQFYADIVAKNVVVDDIVKNRSVDTSKWWLEKRQYKNIRGIEASSDGEGITVKIVDYEG